MAYIKTSYQREVKEPGFGGVARLCAIQQNGSGSESDTQVGHRLFEIDVRKLLEPEKSNG